MTAGVLAVSSSTAAAAIGKTLYVSPKGKDTNKCTKTAPCKTIGHAVGKARKGDTVSVAHGTYREEVSITKDVTVLGVGEPVVNAKGLPNAFLIGGAVGGSHAAGAVVRGFVVENATFEGILAEKTSDLTIAGNTVRGNDQGGSAKKPTGECMAQGNVPGDCGEGVHLMSVTHSKVTRNIVTGNSGGILLTDELGPTAHNLISKNTVTKNVLDCGITVAGHNPQAVTSTGKRQPSVGGIYSNTVSDNVVNGNGTKGFGAGILLATGAGPGSGVYDNVITGNTADGNGLAGITLHSHAPGEDLGGNKIINNRLSNDGSADLEFGESGKVGILVGSGFVKQKGIVITGNTISNTHFGIYTKNAPNVSAAANTFHKVAVPVKQI